MREVEASCRKTGLLENQLLDGGMIGLRLLTWTGSSGVAIDASLDEVVW